MIDIHITKRQWLDLLHYIGVYSIVVVAWLWAINNLPSQLLVTGLWSVAVFGFPIFIITDKLAHKILLGEG